METSMREKEGTLILGVEGRIDASTAPQLEEELLKLISQGKKKLLLDFGKVTYVSSAGLRAILTARWELQKHSGILMLCSVSDNVYKVLKMTGFTSVFKIYSSEEGAFAAG